jgi:hypothetical protein
MKLAAAFAVTLGVLFTAAVTAAGAQSRGVTITSLPSHVAQGGLQHLNANVSKGSGTCSLMVKYASGKKQALGRKPVLAGRIAWTWRVPRTTAAGKAKARISCNGLARTGTFIVTRRLVPASVVVTKSGLTQTPDTYDSGTTISYGLVLVNRSQDESARDVEVDVNLLDAAGNAVAADTDYIIGGIPAGATYYVGHEVFTNGPTAVTHLAASIKVGDSKPQSPVMPVVTNLRLSADQYDGTAIVDGDVTNEGQADLNAYAEISAVFFDSAGDVIGGGSTLPPFALPPGAQTALRGELIRGAGQQHLPSEDLGRSGLRQVLERSRPQRHGRLRPSLNPRW